MRTCRRYPPQARYGARWLLGFPLIVERWSFNRLKTTGVANSAPWGEQETVHVMSRLDGLDLVSRIK